LRDDEDGEDVNNKTWEKAGENGDKNPQ